MMFGERRYTQDHSKFQIPNSRFQYIEINYCKFPVAETQFAAKIFIAKAHFMHVPLSPRPCTKLLHRRDSFHANSLTVANLSLQVFSLLKSCCNIGVLFWNLGILEFYSYEAWLYHSPPGVTPMRYKRFEDLP